MERDGKRQLLLPHFGGRSIAVGYDGEEEEEMNELDKLRKMLDEAEIPYESYQEKWNGDMKRWMNNINRCPADEYRRNQIIYGRTGESSWKIDGVCHFGSYGREQGMIETYGELGTDESGEPMVLNAFEVFKIILADYKSGRKR